MNVTSLPSTCGTHRPERAAASCGVNAVKGSVSQSQSTDITLVTAEGDTVTLSSSFEREVKFETYNSRGESASMLSKSSSSSFSLSIEGDLDRKELRDIRNAIRTIEKVNRTLMRGDLEKAAHQAEKLQRLDTIASLDAELLMTRQVTLETWTGQTSTQALEPPVEPVAPLEPASTAIVVSTLPVAPESQTESTILQELIESSSTAPAA